MQATMAAFICRRWITEIGQHFLEFFFFLALNLRERLSVSNGSFDENDELWTRFQYEKQS